MFIKLALMWAITALLCVATSCHPYNLLQTTQKFTYGFVRPRPLQLADESARSLSQLVRVPHIPPGFVHYLFPARICQPPASRIIYESH